MKIYIMTDQEGVAGVLNSVNFAFIESRYYELAKELLTGEVNAAIRAAKDCGADVIYVNDSHGSAYNILFEELEEGCEIIHGRGGHFPAWLPSLDKTFDAMILVGQHAMGGELDGICPHSKWEVNGGDIYMSEAAMAMALAGDLGIPTVFVSGDQVITAEVQAKNPQIRMAVVKHAYGPFVCRSVLPRRAQKMIFDGVKSGLEQRHAIPPYQVPGPLTLNLLDSPQRHIPPLKPLLKKPVHGQTITEVFEKAVNAFPWNAYGRKIMDYYAYPGNLSGRKPQPASGKQS